jgi:heme/copper-type cytochrome/quinol oxidase subunit 2
MSPSVMLAVAIAVFVLAVVAIRVWAHRSRARPERPVTEAEARAHASPLTRSVLSVTPRGRADQAVPLRSGRAGGSKD